MSNHKEYEFDVDELDDLVDESRVEVVSKDGKRRFKLDVLKNLFFTTDEDVNTFSRRYNLPIGTMEGYAKEGDWDRVRDELNRNQDDFHERLIESEIKAQIDVELRITRLQRLQQEKYLDYLERHYLEYGDLFARDQDTGDLVLTKEGEPKLLKVPNSNNHEVTRKKASVELISGLKKLAQPSPEKVKQIASSRKGKQDYIEIDPKKLFEEANKNTKED